MRRVILVALCATVLTPFSQGQGPSFLGRPANNWVRELSDPRAEVRRSAAFALGQIGGGALTTAPELAKRLSDGDAGVRAMAAESLGDMVRDLRGGGLSVWELTGSTLEKLLAEDADANVRSASAFALGTFRDRAASAAPVLRNALRDADAHVRRSAARAIAEIGEEAAEAVKDLCGLLKDSDSLVRRDAVTALGTIGSPTARSAVRPLLMLLNVETDDVVRHAALDKLVGLVGPDDRAAATELYPLLRGKDPDAARAAAFVLANMGGPDSAPAVPVLQKTLREEDEQKQNLAAVALGSMGPIAAPAVLDLARALTESKIATVRRNAALALSQIGPKARDALPLLKNALAPSELREVRMYAGEAIMKIGSPANDSAIPTLLAIVESDPDPEVRRHSAWCVSRRPEIESNGIAKVFSKVIEETDPDTQGLRYVAAWNLAAHQGSKAPDRTVDIMFDLFRDERAMGDSGTAVRVSSAGGGEADAGKTEVTALRPTGNSTVQIEAARALGFLGKKANRPEIVKALREAMKKDDPELQKAIAEALQRITR
jgi:HEAT repeat protein